MALKRIVYCGNLPHVADELILNQELQVIGILLQKGTLKNEMVQLALLRDIPIVEVEDKMELESAVLGFSNLDAIIICGFGIILSSTLLYKIKAYNFHPGVLPDYKGRHPTFFATISGDRSIGMTLHEVTPEIDAGKILKIEKIPYGFSENENDLFKKYPVAVKSLLPTLILALNGEEIGSQNIGGRYYKPVTENDKSFTANDSPTRILNILRAQARYGGGIFCHQGKKYIVKGTRVQDIDVSWDLHENVYFIDGKIVGIKFKYDRVLRFLDFNLM